VIATVRQLCHDALDRLLKSGLLHHGANAILRWGMAYLMVKADHDGGLKPDKRRSHEKKMQL